MIFIKTFHTESGIPVHFPDVNYSCQACGQCCTMDWNIHIDPRTYKNLRESALYKKRMEETGGEELFIHIPEKDVCILRKVSELCVFQREDKLCEIHAEMGFDAKSLTCRQYPIVLYPTPDGIFVDASFACPSVRENHGIPLEEHFADVEGWLKEYKYNKFGMESIQLAEGVTLDWEGYKVLEEILLRYLETEEHLGMALWKPFMSLVTMYHVCLSKNITALQPVDIRNFLGTPMSAFPFDRDADYLQQEAEFALFLVTLNEAEEELRNEVSTILFTGGTFFARGFGKEIPVEDLQKYVKDHPAPWKDDVLKRYIWHLLWQKHPLKTSTVAGGLGLLNILYPYFEWYVYANAFTRGAEQPEMKDALKALRMLEISIKHDNTGYVERCTSSFTQSIIRQVGIYFGAPSLP